MAARRGMFGSPNCGSNMAIPLLQNQRLPLPSSDPLSSVFISGSSSSFLGSRSMVSFEDINGGNRPDRSFYRSFDPEENGEEDLEEYFHQPEKKRRLTADQVQFLERSFESDNKLEPERKVQLAKDLGLQPRQVAIWFQNRRARWKTRQLEKDYESLQASYNSLKADHDNLLKEKEKLKAEVTHLTDKLHLRVKDSGNSDFSDTNGESKPLPQEHVVESVSEGEVSKLNNVACKRDDLSSSKSEVTDAESPHCTDGGHSSFIERGDSSYVFEPEQSDLSQDEEDNPSFLSKSLLPPPCYGFPEVEDADYATPSANSCYFAFPIEDNAFGFWSY